MLHNVARWQFERGLHAPMGGSDDNVTLVTERNVTYITGWGSVTLRSESAGRGVELPQKMIETAPGTTEPFDADVDGAPLSLELLSEQIGNRLGAIVRPAVSEVKPRPSVHPSTLLHRPKT